MVTAGGNFSRPTSRRIRELFWAVRGGGGNFGVVTAFRFRLHPVGTYWPDRSCIRRTKHLKYWLRCRTWPRRCPTTWHSNYVLATMPPTPDTPPPLRGARTLLVVPAWSGDPITGRLVIDELRRIGKPLADAVAPTPIQRCNRPWIR